MIDTKYCPGKKIKSLLYSIVLAKYIKYLTRVQGGHSTSQDADHLQVVPAKDIFGHTKDDCCAISLRRGMERSRFQHLYSL